MVTTSPFIAFPSSPVLKFVLENAGAAHSLGSVFQTSLSIIFSLYSRMLFVRNTYSALGVKLLYVGLSKTFRGIRIHCEWWPLKKYQLTPFENRCFSYALHIADLTSLLQNNQSLARVFSRKCESRQKTAMHLAS